MLTARSRPAVATSPDVIFVCGGWKNNEGPLNSCEKLRPAERCKPANADSKQWIYFITVKYSFGDFAVLPGVRCHRSPKNGSEQQRLFWAATSSCLFLEDDRMVTSLRCHPLNCWSCSLIKVANGKASLRCSRLGSGTECVCSGRRSSLLVEPTLIGHWSILPRCFHRPGRVENAASGLNWNRSIG